MCVGITVTKWDSTCHSQTHGTEPPVHFCCSHYISPCFLSTPPLSFSLSLLLSLSLSLSLSFSLSLSLSLPPLSLSLVARHMSSDALYQIFSSWSILLFHIISFHSSYKILQLFTDYLLRLPSSELLEKHLFRSRANRRLVLKWIMVYILSAGSLLYIHLRRGDESQPLARIFLFPQRNVVVAAMIEVITPNVLLQSRMNRSPNHLQHLWKTSPCFATLRPPFLSITSHPLANYLVPNPNGRCSPLSFGVPPFSSVFPLL